MRVTPSRTLPYPPFPPAILPPTAGATCASTRTRARRAPSSRTRVPSSRCAPRGASLPWRRMRGARRRVQGYVGSDAKPSPKDVSTPAAAPNPFQRSAARGASSHWRRMRSGPRLARGVFRQRCNTSNPLSSSTRSIRSTLLLHTSPRKSSRHPRPPRAESAHHLPISRGAVSSQGGECEVPHTFTTSTPSPWLLRPTLPTGFEDQAITLSIYDLRETARPVRLASEALPLSPGATLDWLGFNDAGAAQRTPTLSIKCTLAHPRTPPHTRTHIRTHTRTP